MNRVNPLKNRSIVSHRSCLWFSFFANEFLITHTSTFLLFGDIVVLSSAEGLVTPRRTHEGGTTAIKWDPDPACPISERKFSSFWL